MIELGLARVHRLLKHTKLSWRAIHVAGTNGKGSLCAYASAMLHASNIKTGRFTSPHIVDRWDCIAIDEKPITESLFKETEDCVKWRDSRENIQATEFELLTATAFEIFNRENIHIGVIEVGMGGRLDATNVLQAPLATVISRIGLDHQEFLGSTIEAIAQEKAGILKPSVPCVVDGTNQQSVKAVIQAVAQDIGAFPLRFTELKGLNHSEKRKIAGLERLANYQLANYECARQAVILALEQLGHPLESSAQDYALLKSTLLPGRLQQVNVRFLTGRDQPILLDGAHNAQSAALLGEHVDENYRKKESWAGRDGEQTDGPDVLCPVTWVLAASEGKDVGGILRCFLKPGDKVVTTAFGTVDGMPWVKATSPETLLQVASRTCTIHKDSTTKASVLDALKLASTLANDGPLVVAGSLYLVGDVMRLLKDTENKNGSSG